MKVLWCDRNNTYVESFIESTKSILPEIEFVIKQDPVEAIKEILANHQDYKLIISGQIFKHLSGTDLFEIIFKNKIKVPFLLLTAHIDYGQFDNYDLWYSFNYVDKLRSDYFEVANTVAELVNRDVAATFVLHEKLKAFREGLKLSTKEMAMAVGVTEAEVINSESEYTKVTSSYVALLTIKFDIEMSFLVQSSLDYFKQNMLKKDSAQKNSHLG